MTLKLPGQYAKFLTALIGQGLVYLNLYGWAWHVKPAVALLAIAGGVLAVPNSEKPAPLEPFSTTPSSRVTITPPAA